MEFAVGVGYAAVWGDPEEGVVEFVGGWGGLVDADVYFWRG